MQYRERSRIRGYRAPGRERLERLAEFLDGLADESLGFADWRECAVGRAAGEPWFLAQGLSLEPDRRRDACRPWFEGRSDWRAVADFFEIDIETARRLFDSMGYGEVRPAPGRIAAAIRRYVAATTGAR